MAKKRTTIGQMNRRVEINTAADAPFGAHSLKQTLTLVATRWARVEEYSIAKRAAIGIAQNISHKVTIRAGLDVDNNNLLVWDGNVYKVVSTQKVSSERGGSRETFLAIHVEFRGTTDAFDNPSPEPEV